MSENRQHVSAKGFQRQMAATSVSSLRSIFMRIGAGTTVVLAMTACSSLSSLNPFVSDAFKPTELTAFTPELNARLLWSANVGDADDAALQPAASESVAYVSNRAGVVSAIDLETGRPVWKRDLKRRITAGVAVTGGAVVLAAERGLVIALDQDGRDLWVFQASTEVLTPPTANQGTVIVRAADGRITALDAANGRRRWSFQRQLPPLTLRAPEPVTIAQSTAYASYAGGKLLAMNLTNGNLRWEATVALPKGATEIERISDVSGAPVVSLRQVCAATFQGRIGCFDLQNGNAAWTRDFSSTVGISADDRYVIAFNEKGEMMAFSRDGGALVWRNELFVYRKPQTPVVVGRSVVFSDVEGYIHAVSRDTGKMLARVQVKGGEASGPMQAAERRLLLQTRDGYLNAVALE